MYKKYAVELQLINVRLSFEIIIYNAQIGILISLYIFYTSLLTVNYSRYVKLKFRVCMGRGRRLLIFIIYIINKKIHQAEGVVFCVTFLRGIHLRLVRVVYLVRPTQFVDVPVEECVTPLQKQMFFDIHIYRYFWLKSFCI